MAAVRRERTWLCAPPESLLQEEPTRIKPPRDLWGAPAGRAHGGPGSWGAGRPRLVLPLFTAGSRGSAGDSGPPHCVRGVRSRLALTRPGGVGPRTRRPPRTPLLRGRRIPAVPAPEPLALWPSCRRGAGGQLTAAAAQARSPFRVPFATYALTWRLALLASGSYRRQRAAVFCRV